MSYIPILKKVYSDVHFKCPDLTKHVSSDYLTARDIYCFNFFGNLMNKLLSEGVNVKNLLDAYLFGNNNLNNWTKSSNHPKISIKRNLYTYIGITSFLKFEGSRKFSDLSEFDRKLMLFTNVRNIASFVKYTENTDLYGKAKTVYALNLIIRETLIYKHKTTFAYKLFKYLATINHEDMCADDINLLIGLHNPDEHKSIKEFLKDANIKFFEDNLPLAKKFEAILNRGEIDDLKYKFLYELFSVPVKDFQKYIGNFLKHRGDIYSYEEKEFHVSALALGYLEIKPDLKLLSDLMTSNHSAKLKRAITNLINAFHIPHLSLKSPFIDGYVKPDSYNDFKHNIDKCTSMLDLVELLERNTPHILTIDNEILYNKILNSLEDICRLHLTQRIYFDDDILKNLERMAKDSKLWSVLVYLVTNSKYLGEDYVEQILIILEEKGSQRARLCLFNGYMNGAYGIKKNDRKAENILKKLK